MALVGGARGSRCVVFGFGDNVVDLDPWLKDWKHLAAAGIRHNALHGSWRRIIPFLTFWRDIIQAITPLAIVGKDGFLFYCNAFGREREISVQAKSFCSSLRLCEDLMEQFVFWALCKTVGQPPSVWAGTVFGEDFRDRNSIFADIISTHICDEALN